MIRKSFYLILCLGGLASANPEPEPKLTFYGYPDDPTPDYYSSKGIGDRNNKLIAEYSVALTLAERFARFGINGHSTGKEFFYNGKRCRDDDTAPQLDRRIDFYTPQFRERKIYHPKIKR